MIFVVDTSAVIAILQDEPEAPSFSELLADGAAAISAGTLIETLRVVRLRRSELAADRAWELVRVNRIEIVPVDEAQVALAEDGMRRFGQGRGERPALLNFGDLFSYALARHLDAPLLYKGDDFRRTDVKALVPPPPEIA